MCNWLKDLVDLDDKLKNIYIPSDYPAYIEASSPTHPGWHTDFPEGGDIKLGDALKFIEKVKFNSYHWEDWTFLLSVENREYMPLFRHHLIVIFDIWHDWEPYILKNKFKQFLRELEQRKKLFE